jgi:spermidine synthase
MIKIILDFDGIFSFRVTSQINYISSEQSLYLSSLYHTLSEVFEKVKILPGPNAIFLASSQRELFSDWEKIVSNLERNHVEAEYVNRNFLFDRLHPQRISNLKSSVFSKSGKVNTDLKPISYFYNTILWSTQLNSFEKKIFLMLKDVKSIWYLLIPSLFFFASLSFFFTFLFI